MEEAVSIPLCPATGKIVYGSAVDAGEALRRVRGRRGGKRRPRKVEKRVYCCETCRLFHITSMEAPHE